jgi:CHASE3 domain sensor protein
MVMGAVGAAVTVARLSNSAKWVAHTYEVKLAVAKIEFILSEAARARLSYVSSGDEAYLETFKSANDEENADLARIRDLTIDNARQLELCNQLEKLSKRRLEVLKEAIDLRKSGQRDDAQQAMFSRDNMAVAQNIDNVTQKMEQEEDQLLDQRVHRSADLFIIFLVILATAFAVAVAFFWIHYRLLTDELGAREQAEASAHKLSARVLRLQDEERRRLSRELHEIGRAHV